MKAVIVVLSDPNGGEESLGRMFNALAVAYDLKQKGQEVEVLFQGTGTRWIGKIADPKHPVHTLYKAVEDKIAGASLACAAFFGATADVEKNGCDFVTGNAVPGTEGLPSLEQYAKRGYAVMTF